MAAFQPDNYIQIDVKQINDNHRHTYQTKLENSMIQTALETLELKHAPGPWIERNGHITTLSCFEKRFSDKICTLEWGNTDEDKANGQLISVSPDLLRLANHLDAMRNDAYLTGHPEWHDIIRELDLIKNNLER